MTRQPEPSTGKAAILDFGGVVTRTLFETHDLTEQALGLAPGTLQWRGPFDPGGDDLWRRMQADEISERAYWQMRTKEVANLVGESWTAMSDFVQAARGAMPQAIIRPEFLGFIEDVRAQGITLAILSNELDLFYGKAFRTKLDFLKHFSIIHDATYTKILKPAPRAYQGCLDEIGLPPQQCVFIDDQKRNILGAKDVGLKTVHFNVLQPQASYDEARRMLGI